MATFDFVMNFFSAIVFSSHPRNHANFRVEKPLVLVRIHGQFCVRHYYYYFFIYLDYRHCFVVKTLNMKLYSFLLLLFVSLTASTSNVSITFPQVSGPENAVAPEPPKVSEPPNNPFKEAAHYVANLGLKTLRDLLTIHSNVIISPLNVYSCLGILNLGAVGETREEIRRILGPSNQNRTISEIIGLNNGVSYASALFLDQDFVPKEEFKNAALAEFQASVLNVNVSDGEQAKESINRWVSVHTNGTIENLLQDRLDSNTKMVVVSALLFKGKWLHSFPTAATAPGKFEMEDSSVEVPLMHLLASVPLVRNVHFDAISLPYIDSHGMTMHVILPKTRGTSALKQILSHLNSNSLKKLRKESLNEEIFIIMPKMKIEGRFSLSETLKKQGISAMFNPSKANFSAVADDGSGLFVSQVYHTIHFEMDEEGTVASAATASILTKSSRFIFRANRPFIFVITDEYDFVMFMGVIVNPVP